MIIEQATSPSPELLEALQRLIPQLTKNNPPPQAGDLESLLADPASLLLIARQPDREGSIVGVGALGVYRVPTGTRAVIEDVVVDHALRGSGIGEALITRLLELARQMGAPGVSLTSNPQRLAANRLYVRMGFSLRQTNCYYYKFS